MNMYINKTKINIKDVVQIKTFSYEGIKEYHGCIFMIETYPKLRFVSSVHGVIIFDMNCNQIYVSDANSWKNHIFTKTDEILTVNFE